MDKITPEYIAEQSKILDQEDLIELIQQYGIQEREEGERYEGQRWFKAVNR